MNEIPTHQAEPQENIELPLPTPQEERIIFQRTWNEEKKERHVDNIEHFTGFYHGKYYREEVKHGGH